MENKSFYLFAGVNGAGKTTLFNAMNGNVKKSFRINSDEIVREIGKWDSETDQVKAAKIAVGLRNECMEKGNSFNEETTLTGKTILKLIDKVREKNYKLHLFYVGVGSPDISKERIKKRVADGGHHIPDEVVDKRYKESLKNFEKILKKFDNVVVYDNSVRFRTLLRIIDKKVIKIADDLPEWMENTINNNYKVLEVEDFAFVRKETFKNFREI
jgi:hypothetical protein